MAGCCTATRSAAHDQRQNTALFCPSICLSLCLAVVSRARMLLRFRQVTLISSVCLVVCLPCVLTSTADVFAAGDAFCAPSLTRPPGAHFASRRSTPAAAVRLNKNDIEEPPVFGSIKDLEGELLRYARHNSLSPSRDPSKCR